MTEEAYESLHSALKHWQCLMYLTFSFRIGTQCIRPHIAFRSMVTSAPQSHAHENPKQTG